MGLQQFERRLERMVEGAFARAFRGELQPIELGRRLTREMDLRRSVSVRGMVAPNSFVIELSPADHERFSGFADALTKELAELARDHARNEGYTFLGPVTMALRPDEGLQPSTFEVTAEVVDDAGAVAGWLVLPDGRRIEVTAEPVTIGRLAESTIPLSDPNVSRHHAEIRRDGDQAVLFDLGSTNGTKVNGVAVQQTRPLNDGDIVTLGRTAIRFEGS